MPSYNQYVKYALDRQPDNENLLQTTAFIFVMTKAPEVVYFCQSASVPSISVIDTPVLSKHPTLHFADPKLNYDPLTLSFLVNEDMGNWMEIYNWMRSFTIHDETLEPRNRSEIRLSGIANSDDPYSASSKPGDPSDYQVDGTLVLLNSNSLPQASITFKDLYPSSLGELDLNASDGEASPVTCSLTLQYRDYEVTVY